LPTVVDLPADAFCVGFLLITKSKETRFMIGNAFPYKDTGYVILERGDLNKSSQSFELKGYMITDRNGEIVAEVLSFEEAEAYLEQYFAAPE